jgi:hypothetical protein
MSQRVSVRSLLDLKGFSEIWEKLIEYEDQVEVEAKRSLKEKRGRGHSGINSFCLKSLCTQHPNSFNLQKR